MRRGGAMPLPPAFENNSVIVISGGAVADGRPRLPYNHIQGSELFPGRFFYSRSFLSFDNPLIGIGPFQQIIHADTVNIRQLD